MADLISRREFLLRARNVAIGGCFVGAGAVAVKWFLEPSTPNNIESPSIFSPDLVFNGEKHQYEGKEAEIIEKIKSDFGVSIISPKIWGEKNEINLKYGIKDIMCVAQTISQLPSEYWHSSRSPKEILLLRVPGSNSEGAGGGYNSRRMVLYTSETFDPDLQFQDDKARKMYGKQGNHLRATICHEWTHSFVEENPALLNDFIGRTGWKSIDDKWKNNNSANLIRDGGADVSPNEDIAVSAGLMLVNSEFLSDDRRNFFLSNPHYQSWSSVTAYKENHH